MKMSPASASCIRSIKQELLPIDKSIFILKSSFSL